VLPKIDLDGVGVSRGTPDELVRALGGHIARRGPAAAVVAVNVHTLAEAGRSPEYRAALNEAGIAFVDGVPVRWLLRASRLPAPPRVHGADLMARLLEGLPEAKHFFYGSTPEALEELRTSLQARWPALRFAGFHSPPFRKGVPREDPAVLERINASGADILWVALGAPKQELWARLHRDALRVPVVACVGAAFEILAGRFTRAPKAMQALGLEWAWRLLQDPWRLWRRYFPTNGRFLVRLARAWLGLAQ
jgi:N-acetylglucosaminyldiphosphoundecaprenol N-acetyl-beta-D-mannosaminyltransferase